MEKDLKGQGFIKEKKEGQGPKGKTTFLPPLVTVNRGGGDWGAGGPMAGVLGHGGG